LAIRTKKSTVILAVQVVKSLLPTSLLPSNLAAKGHTHFCGLVRVSKNTNK